MTDGEDIGAAVPEEEEKVRGGVDCTDTGLKAEEPTAQRGTEGERE